MMEGFYRFYSTHRFELYHIKRAEAKVDFLMSDSKKIKYFALYTHNILNYYLTFFSEHFINRGNSFVC